MNLVRTGVSQRAPALLGPGCVDSSKRVIVAYRQRRAEFGVRHEAVFDPTGVEHKVKSVRRHATKILIQM